MKTTKDIEEKIKQLPPESFDELNQFIDELIEKAKIHHPRKLKQNWACKLKEVKMTSVELQKKSLDWR